VIFGGAHRDSVFLENNFVMGAPAGFFSSRGYIAKLTPNGTFDWLSSNCNNSRNQLATLKIVNGNDLLVLGDYTGDLDFANGTSVSSFGTDGYLSYYSQVTDLDFIPTISNINLAIAPNPAVERIQIEIDLEESDHIDFEIINTAGQVVKRIEGDNMIPGKNFYDIKISSIPSGIYFLKVYGKEHFVVRKFEKI